uniref:Uncharacterized protein n=1 Tax=Anopheles arabiensis TaxID=7173 RepID=A0A182IGA0_ANOAR
MYLFLYLFFSFTWIYLRYFSKYSTHVYRLFCPFGWLGFVRSQNDPLKLFLSFALCFSGTVILACSLLECTVSLAQFCVTRDTGHLSFSSTGSMPSLIALFPVRMENVLYRAAFSLAAFFTRMELSCC